MSEPTLYELSVPGRCGPTLPECDVSDFSLPDALVRDRNGLPSLSQQQVVRHYVRLSQHNYGVDSGFYPLGSCTMKYNPKISEACPVSMDLPRPIPCSRSTPYRAVCQ